VEQRIVLGSRGSELALTQTRLVEDALRKQSPHTRIETRVIKTSGDERPGAASTPLPPGGRKGMFTAEIERALLDETIDVAVHSAKDLPSELNERTTIAAALPRARIEDVLVSRTTANWESLPRDATVATGSVRRRHQLLWQRRDLNVIDLRGNVPTRFRKLTASDWNGVILARAGLERLGYKLTSEPIQFDGRAFQVSVLPTSIFVPAGGQGIIALQVRADDDRMRRILEPISDRDTGLCLRAEREFLRLLQCDCNQPVGVFATIRGTRMNLHGQVFGAAESEPRVDTVEGEATDGVKLAAELFDRISHGG
jgi:hydroxymethylbilane synthase